MTAPAPIHLLPEVQSPPTAEERRVRDLERDLAALRGGVRVLVIATVVLMVLVLMILIGAIA